MKKNVLIERSYSRKLSCAFKLLYSQFSRGISIDFYKMFLICDNEWKFSPLLSFSLCLKLYSIFSYFSARMFPYFILRCIFSQCLMWFCCISHMYKLTSHWNQFWFCGNWLVVCNCVCVCVCVQLKGFGVSSFEILCNYSIVSKARCPKSLSPLSFNSAGGGCDSEKENRALNLCVCACMCVNTQLDDWGCREN